MKIVAWIAWLIVVGASVAAGFVLLMFGLSGPDHPVAAHIASRRIAVTVLGLAIPFTISIGFMVKSRFGYGLLFALLMFPLMFWVGLMLGV